MKPVAIIKIIDKDSGSVISPGFESELELDYHLSAENYKVFRFRQGFNVAITSEYERDLTNRKKRDCSKSRVNGRRKNNDN